MMRTLSLSFVIVAMLSPCTFAAQGSGEGGGHGGRQRAGRADSRCGTDLVVVRTDGSKEQFASIEKFFDAFATRQIDQGEKPRTAVQLDAVLKAYAADWVEALDCENRSVQLPSGLPMEGQNFLLLTGRNTLKVVWELRHGEYRNTAQQVRKLTFHLASGIKHPPAPAARP